MNSDTSSDILLKQENLQNIWDELPKLLYSVTRKSVVAYESKRVGSHQTVRIEQ